MTLNQRLVAFIQAVGADIKALYTAVEQPTSLVEYTDTDKPSASVGDQWIRVNSLEQNSLQGLVGGFPLTNQTPTVQLRTQTSSGVI